MPRGFPLPPCQAKREKGEGARAHRQEALRRAALHAWRLRLGRRRRAQAAAAHGARSLACRALRAWRAGVLRGQQKAGLAAQVRLRKKLSSPRATLALLGALGHLQGIHDLERSGKDELQGYSSSANLQALRWWAGSAKAAAFARWAAYAALRCQLRQRIGRATARHAWRRLLRVFSAWREAAAARAAKRARLQRARGRMAGHRLCVSFDAW